MLRSASRAASSRPVMESGKFQVTFEEEEGSDAQSDPEDRGWATSSHTKGVYLVFLTPFLIKHTFK